jgi:hypothetical protein
VEAAATGARGLLRLRDRRFLDRAAWTHAVDLVAATVRRYGEEHQLRHGIGKGELKGLLTGKLGAGLFDEALDALLGEKKLVIQKDRIAVPDAGPALSAEQERAIRKVEDRLQGSGFQVPDLSGVLREVPPSAKPTELARYLVDSGRAVRVTSELLYPAPLWFEIERRVRDHFARGPSLTMAEFKDLLQVSRKYAVPLLEHMDRTGLTRRHHLHETVVQKAIREAARSNPGKGFGLDLMLILGILLSLAAILFFTPFSHSLGDLIILPTPKGATVIFCKDFAITLGYTDDYPQIDD